MANINMKMTTGSKKTLKRLREILENENFIKEYELTVKPNDSNKHKKIYELTRRYKLDIDPFVFDYLYLNKEFSLKEWEYLDVCKFSDDFDEYFNQVFNYIYTKKPLPQIPYKRKHYEIYPVSIGISPSASQSEVIEYVKANWNNIRQALDKYGKQTKYKKRDKKDRDNFIYKNKSVPTEILLDEVERLFGDKLGYEQLYTIINTETKTRTKK